MLSTNGHGPSGATAILYARVSNRSQAERGLSIPGQFRELRAWAEREGHRVLEEVPDTGGKDSKRDIFERPGINRILDLTERGGVSMVVAQARDRFGEQPIPDFLAYQLAKHGTDLRALDSSGEGEDGELGDMLRGWMAKRERDKTTRRSRSRKLEMARQGWIVASHTPAFGFGYTGDKKARTFALHEEHMGVVERIFRMIGVEGLGVRTVARTLNQEDIPTPPHPTKKKRPEWGKDWSRPFILKLILNDAYKAHTPEEIGALVRQGFMAADVAARLDPEERYGIWWYRGKDYDGNEHQVAVPVPDSGVPRDWVDAARKVIENNVSSSSSGDRGEAGWELSGGFLFCEGCGHRMQTHTVKKSKRTHRIYHYYRCPTLQTTARKRCPLSVRLPAERVEEVVWGFVAGLLSSPEQIVAGLERRIEQERSRLRGAPEEDARELYGKLEVLAHRREAYQDQQAAGYMTLDELGAKLEELEDVKEAIERELEACRNRTERIAELEATRDIWSRRGELWETLDDMREWTSPKRTDETDDEYRARLLEVERAVEHGAERYEGILSGKLGEARQAKLLALQNATPEQRRERYGELELRVTALSKEELEVSGVFDPETVYMSETSRWLLYTPTTQPERCRG